MTIKQMKILKNIKKQKKLFKVLKKSGFTEDQYIELQTCFGNYSYNYIEFSDNEFDESTCIYLTSEAEEILETHRRETLKLIVPYIALAVSIASFVKSFFF